MDPGILVQSQNYVLVLDLLDSNQKLEFETYVQRTRELYTQEFCPANPKAEEALSHFLSHMKKIPFSAESYKRLGQQTTDMSLEKGLI